MKLKERKSKNVSLIWGFQYRFGPRFPAMNNSYDQRLRQLAKQVAKDIGIDQYIREGVYVMLGGPAYETVAELRLLRMLGVDAVGTLLFP